MSEKKYPKVGIGVYILDSKCRVLLLKEQRNGSAAWSGPGGHLEVGEEFLDCLKRETKEETGLSVIQAELWAVNNNIILPDYHYVNFDFLVTEYSGKPKIMEPEKCLEIGWFELNRLPEPLLMSSYYFFKRNPPCLCRSGKKYLECHGKKD